LLDLPPPPLPGVVSVVVQRAKSLKAMDRGGTSDPYAVVRLLHTLPKEFCKTKVVSKELNPVWNAAFDLISPNLHCEHLIVAVYDKDYIRNDLIGQVSISLAQLMSFPGGQREVPLKLGGTEALWYDIKMDTDQHRVTDQSLETRGKVQLRIDLLSIPPPQPLRFFILTVTVHEGRALAARDKGGTSDPYVIIRFQQQQHRTREMKKNLNPKWAETFVLDLVTAGLCPLEPVMLSVWDKNSFTVDELIGEVSINVEHVLQILPTSNIHTSTTLSSISRNGRAHTEWLVLHDHSASSNMTGEVLVEVSATEKIQFTDDQGTDLSVSSRSAVGRLGRGSFFELEGEKGNDVMGKKAAKDNVAARSVVHMQIRLLEEVEEDQTSLSSAKRNEASASTTQASQPLFGCDAQASLALETTAGEAGASEKAVSVGIEMTLHVHVVAGKYLKAMDRGGTSDPYICVQVGTLAKDKTEKKKKFQTKVVKKNLNPEWDEVFRVVLSLQERQGELLRVQVYDKDLFGADDLIGELDLPLVSLHNRCEDVPKQSDFTSNLYSWHHIYDKTNAATGQVRLGRNSKRLLP
jgi:Ca2+-dependent lipid-binding protein